MKRILDFVTRELQVGGLLSWTLCLMAIVIFTVDAFLNPERKYMNFFFVMLGLVFGWRHYVIWKRKRAQRGIELLGTEDPPVGLK